VRIVLFTGKGGVGKTTTSSATALRLADRGLKTLLLSTDAAHSLADALGTPLTDEPIEVVPGLHALQIDTQRRFEAAWVEVQQYLIEMVAQGGVDPITAEELTILPGIDEVLALLAVRELAESGTWDVIVVDCAPTAETLRLLALPEALGWYLQRVFPIHRKLAKGMRPITSLLGKSGAIPPDAVFGAVVRLADDLAAVQKLLANPEITSVRLVLTPETVVTAEARRTFTALALYGYQVDEVVANRVFPEHEDTSQWQRQWIDAQRRQLASIADSFAGLPVRQATYFPHEPVGPDALRQVATVLYGDYPGVDPAAEGEPRTLISVEADPASGSGLDQEFVLTVNLPLADAGAVEATRSGDDLVVTVSGHRRVLTLPSVLRRCAVVGGTVAEEKLQLRFRPDPAVWRAL